MSEPRREPARRAEGRSNAADMYLYECDVPENLPEMKLAAYLSKAFPLLTQNTLRDALKKKDVKVDNTRQGADTMAVRGTHVRLYTMQKAELPIVFENDDVIVINKPAGISTCEDSWGGMTAENVLQNVMGKGSGVKAVHRLDNQTSGLVMFAKNETAAMLLEDEFRDRDNILKEYICDVKGQMRPESAVKEAYLIKDAVHAKVRVISHNTPGAKKIITEYQALSCEDGISRLRVTLHTGRTHQIRAHMASLGHPLVGDDLYGDRMANRRLGTLLHLCAEHLCFSEQISVESLRGVELRINVPF